MIKSENKHNSWVFLIILVLIVGLITYYRLKMHLYLWPAYDTYDLLANAALFAGKGIGYSDLLRPPLLPFLTSIYFMFHGLNMWVISVIDGILYILGCIGVYLFLKERFTALISFLGGLLYATSPLIIIFAAVGYNDIPSVSIGIWALYFTYLAVKRNPKFFYLAFPVAMLSVLTKYNMALLIFPIFTYILMSRDEIKNTKDIIGGICLGALVLTPVLLFFNAKFGNPIYPFMDFLKTSGSSFSSGHFAYNPDLLYFVKNLPHYLGIPSLLIVFSTLLALLFSSYKKIGKIGTLSWNRISEGNNIQIVILLLLLTILIITFGKLHYMVSEVLFVAVILLTYNIFVTRNWDFGMDLLFLSWFATFFIFHSAYMNKDHRYFIFMAAPIAYFLVRGLTFFTETFQVNFKKKNITLYIFSALLILLMVSSTISRFDDIEKANIDNKEFNENVRDACNWLKNYDPEYKSRVIYADFWAIFAWHLQMDVGKMPTFRNNQTI
ncbi:MAG TPA: glycosyltransferase family 39 protein, partial [Methanothermobacter sp.]|nr:glycosyltransferase family 39 protein [Methanothermobacter sp.]